MITTKHVMRRANTKVLACIGKVKHTSYAEANQSLCRQRKITGSKSKHMKVEPYKCGYCGTWHIGHNKKRPQIKHDTLTLENKEQ